MNLQEIDSELATHGPELEATEQAIQAITEAGSTDSAAIKQHLTLMSKAALLKNRITQLTAMRPPAELQHLRDQADGLRDELDRGHERQEQIEAEMRTQLEPLFGFKGCPIAFTEIVGCAKPVFDVAQDNAATYVRFRSAVERATRFAADNRLK